jgi:RNA polymerase sigma factor (sigma-70 family)
MSTGPPHDILRQLRRAALLSDGAGMTDVQLLECFIARRDEAAFEALVRRHGPMVLGVCRRVLRHAQDAEDAFQATFLVLVRKAAGLGRRELLGNWLYGVAYRTALDARAAAARRRARERRLDPMREPEAREEPDACRDLRPLLDQELARLPDKYRAAIVLCDLQGGTRREVARQLGIPVGTLSGRLTTARRLLARRLARHGLALSAGLLTAALSEATASPGLPPPLVAKAVATAVAAGSGAAAGASLQVTALAERVLKAMLVNDWKIITAVVMAAAVIVGAGLLAHPPMAAQPVAESAPRRAQAAPADRDAGVPRILRLDSRGRRVAWSPDGKTLAVVTKVERTLLGFQYDRNGSAIRLWDVETGAVRDSLAESRDKGLAYQQVVFSADSKTIAATVAEAIGRDVINLWDAKTLAAKQKLGGDSQLVCVALSVDGKLVAGGDPSKKAVRLWNARTGAPERTLDTGEAQPWSLAFSPDSRSLAVGGQKGDHSGEVSLWDVKAGKAKYRLKQLTYVTAVAFSPDGKMLAGSSSGQLIQVWDVQKGELIVFLTGSQHGQRTIAFSPDSTLVAAGGHDGKVRLWDARTGKLNETLQGHGDEVHSIAFSPDGKTLASASQDETLRLWPLSKPPAGRR